MLLLNYRFPFQCGFPPNPWANLKDFERNEGSTAETEQILAGNLMPGDYNRLTF
jgi:hypothetical protein